MILYILGTPYSGSTLVSNYLGAHPDVSVIGEFNRLRGFGQYNGDPFEDRQYGVYCSLCFLRKRSCTFWTPEYQEYLPSVGVRNAYESLYEKSGAKVLVDCSKSVRWLHEYIDSGGDLREVRILNIVRNPYAFCYSYMTHTGVPAYMAANEWRDALFDVNRFSAQYSIPILTVKFDEFSRNPAGLQKKVLQFVGLEHQDEMVQYWNRDGHPLGGNTSAYLKYSGISLDMLREDWQEGAKVYKEKSHKNWQDNAWYGNLTTGDIREIMGTPMLASVASLNGYFMADDLLAISAHADLPGSTAYRA